MCSSVASEKWKGWFQTGEANYHTVDSSLKTNKQIKLSFSLQIVRL
jgi:hypothetical protein